MDKLDIHEFLRIYLPGLYISSATARMLFGSAVDSSATATVSIFVGLAFSWLAAGFANRYFQHITNKKVFDHSGEKLDYWTTWIRLFEKRREKSPKVISLEKNDVERLSFSHYVRRYGSPELYGFRIQKTFGVLYFSLALASVVLALIPISSIFTGWPQKASPAILSWMCFYLSRCLVYFSMPLRVISWNPLKWSSFIGSIRQMMSQ